MLILPCTERTLMPRVVHDIGMLCPDWGLARCCEGSRRCRGLARVVWDRLPRHDGVTGPAAAIEQRYQRPDLPLTIATSNAPPLTDST